MTGVICYAVHFVPAHVDVEADVSSVAEFIQGTNSVVLVGHGITTLGRTLSEATTASTR